MVTLEMKKRNRIYPTGESHPMHKHGHSGVKRTPTYTSWLKMKERCNNHNHNRAHIYSKKGILYDERWESFEQFITDMGERPKGTSLDRIDSNEHYWKGNCRWATAKQQSCNTCRNVYFEVDGVTYTQSDVFKVIGTTLKRFRNMRANNALPENVKQVPYQAS
jgi:hypothetical protein